MSRTLLRNLLFGAALGLLSGCPQQAGDPTLTVRASPKTISSQGQRLADSVSLVAITATDGFDNPGTGSVQVHAPAGTLLVQADAVFSDAGLLQVAGSSALAGLDVALTDGGAAVYFYCGGDPLCVSSVKVTTDWTPRVPKGATAVSASTTLTITAPPPDAGSGGVDAGSELPAGTTDGGFFNKYTLGLSSPRVVLLEGTTDTATINAQVMTNSTNPQPVVGKVVSFTASSGASFSGTTAQPTATATTDATGLATVTLRVGTATRGLLSVVATVPDVNPDAQATMTLRVVKAQTLSQTTGTPATATGLAIRSTGQGFSTTVYFQVKDTANNPLAGVPISFALGAGAAAGCSIAPASAVTDVMGTASTLVTSGDSQGNVAVVATILGVDPTTSASIPIVVGVPADGSLSVTCARSTLGARESTTPSQPRTDISVACTANFTDRNAAKVPFATTVSWLAEVGQIDGSSVAAANSGHATATFNTSGAFPVETTPLLAQTIGGINVPAEPTNGSLNPRDSFVTIIAALSGEEQFWDGSGGQQQNGKWDPGEWYVDLPEPFVDSNDDGIWSPGEPYIDTEHIDCATGATIAKNNKWDPPNGCWDRATQIWRPTHVVYSDTLVNGPELGTFIVFSPALQLSYIVSAQPKVYTVSWFDRFFNRLSSDSAAISVTGTPAARGTFALTTDGLNTEDLGHDLRYVTYRAGELPGGGFKAADGTFAFTNEGACDVVTLPVDAGTSKCVRTYGFYGWRTKPTTFTLTVTNATAQPPLPDGGSPPATTNVMTLLGKNAYQSNSSYSVLLSFQ